MPTYTYKCNDEECEEHFDVVQKISEDPLTECPSCKKQTLQKVISPGNFHLKGRGWYKTDFKHK